MALAWVLEKGMAAIPRSGSPDHVRENRGAVDLHLHTEALDLLGKAFPPPSGPTPLEILLERVLPTLSAAARAGLPGVA